MNAMSSGYRVHTEAGPIVAAAIHAGHSLRPGIAAHMALNDCDRLREEDPHTDGWVDIGDTQIVVDRSRFEVDVNRPRESAVYCTPGEAWGLRVWHDACPAREETLSRLAYDDFYDAMARCFDGLLRVNEKVIVLDLHSYNHRRDGPSAAPADPRGNPDINVGTGSLTTPGYWRSAIDRFIEALSLFAFGGRRLDVRENMRFRGGHFARWLHTTYPGRVCCLSVEVKKIFMNEWSGELDPAAHALVHEALRSGVPGLRAFLSRKAALGGRTS
jgi:N-formylglutamate amidohydrolase